MTTRSMRGPHTVFGIVAAFAMLSACAVAMPGVSRADEAARAIAIAEDERRFDDDGLGRYLASPQPALRARAALAVGRLQDSTTVSAMLPLLDDPNAEVRREAVFALGQIGHASAREAIEAHLTDPDVATIDLAIEALGKIGDTSSTEKVSSFLYNENVQLRQTAAVALWRLADSTAIDVLIERHEDPNPLVRWRILYALEKIVTPSVVLIAALHSDDPNWIVRAQAARTLGRQKSTRGTSYLLQMFDDEVPAVIVNALRGLQQVADSTCGFCVRSITNALSHEHPHVRVTAAQTLGQPFALAAADSGTRATALDTLRARIADSDAATRAAAAGAWLAIQGPSGWDDVKHLLEDRSIYVRTAMLQAVGSLESPEAEQMLLERLYWQTPIFERMTAALAVGSNGSKRAAAHLRAELYDQQILMVAASAAALEQLGDTSAVASLTTIYPRHANDGDADARIAIRDALRTLAGRAYADSIENAHPALPAEPDAYAADFGTPPNARGAILHTTKGEIEWRFFAKEAPQTVANFARLAKSGYFNGLSVHRVVPNFVIQDGDPTGTGWSGPGYTIRCEYNRLRYDAGRVGMALSGKDTGGSQWFITHAPQPHLDGRYTIFAEVVRGMEVVHAIVQGDRVLRVEILQ